MDAGTTPRRFRRRLLVVTITLGLAPLLAWAATSHFLTSQILSLRPARLDSLLSDVDEHLGDSARDETLRQEIAATRLNLAQVELTRRSLSRLMPRLLLVALTLTAALLALSAILSGRQLARPLELLTDGMERYGRGDLAHRLPETRSRHPDEMQFLVRQFNLMGDELAGQRARLEVTEAVAAWQGVARALAHELKNPLTAMRMAVGRLARLEAAPAEDAAQRQQESLTLLERQVDALLRLAQSFSDFAKLPAPVPRAMELAPLVAEVCALYRHTSPVPLEDAVPPEMVVEADAQLLARALGNLVKNAVEASSPGDPPVRVTASAAGREMRLEVTDGGRGIGTTLEGAALARSLGTTKAEGSGLGLPIAHKIIHEHGGSLRLEPRPQGGTTAVVVLPLGGRA